jgi:hypothetical protein
MLFHVTSNAIARRQLVAVTRGILDRNLLELKEENIILLCCKTIKSILIKSFKNSRLNLAAEKIFNQ